MSTETGLTDENVSPSITGYNGKPIGEEEKDDIQLSIVPGSYTLLY